MTDWDREAAAPLPATDGPEPVSSRPHVRVATSTVSLVASSLVVALLGGVALHVVTTKLGRDSYGTLVTVINFISISLLFADLGINTYSGREIARDRTKASAILSENLGLRLCLSLVMAPIVIGIAVLIPAYSHHSTMEGIALVALTLPFEAIRAVSVSYYVASIQNYKTAFIGVISQVVYVAGVVTTLHLGFGLVGCFLSFVASAVVTAAFAFVAVRREAPFRPRFAAAGWRNIVRNSLGIGSIQIVNVLYLRTNTLLLSVMTNRATVAIYGFAAAIVTFLLVIPNAYMTSMMPLVVTAPPEKLTSMVNTACAYMSMIGVLAVVGTTSVAGDFIDWFTTRQYTGSAPVLSILSISVLFTCVTSVFSYASFARDHHHRLFVISCGGLCLNVLLDLVLIPSIGAKGAATATVVVESLILVGTYAIFRSRVGNHFTAWARQGRIYAVGAIVALVVHLGLDRAFGAGVLRLLVVVVTVPVLFTTLAICLRCLPTPVRWRGPGSLTAWRQARRAA